ncbi:MULTISPECIES: PAS domain-containing sensor histidine kinase [unclassified Fusibacter]|uniref:sensor histidine kinase n=1 Tax=unclassified Fusibacter TaxID=2624464 RepID=UPI001012E71D|nr:MULTISPECIES: PAS domain-containing sensor histidine kinase [unclassified Fusibacter]MCK8059429.1 PAS domain S-box protein [Fusibacter sp. A2]NPE21107.1 PAS domain S-box protein [Fusibacter sp. A1]RXV62377.1 PAS domain S-box protein [Fusibacter sp. A1]
MSLKSDFLSIFPTSMDEMNLNPLTMMFKGKEEANYWSKRLDKELGQKRIGIIIGVLIYLLFALTDAVIMPEVKDLAWFFRFTFYIASSLIVFIVTYTEFAKKSFHYLMALLMFIAGVGHILILMQAPASAVQVYDLGILIFIVYGFMVLRTQYLYAFISMAVLTLSFIGYVYGLSPLEGPQRLTVTLMTLLGFIISGVGSYFADYSQRRNYYLTTVSRRTKVEEHRTKRSKETQVEVKPVVRTVESPVNKLFEHITDVIWFISLDGEIKYISSSVKEFLGYEPEELIGKRSVMMMTNEAYAAFDRSASRLYRDKNIVQATYEYKTKAGLIKMGEAFVKSHSDKRFGEGYVGSTRPLTDDAVEARATDENQMKKLQEETEDLRQLNSNLMTEVDDLKHKIHRVHEEQDKKEEVPMYALAEALEKVAEHYADNTKVQLEAHHRELEIINDKFTEMTMSKYDLENYFNLAKKKIHDTSNSLDILTDRISLFNHYLMASDTLDVRTYQLRSLLEESVLKLKHFFKHTKHIIEIDCPRGIELDVDKTLFEHVINNMIINSLQFSFAQVRNGKIEISVEKVGKQVFITYKDDGEKIQADVIDEMFAGIINQNVNALEGMELHIVRQIIESHMKGSIGCAYDNQKNTFKVVLPIEN